ncbi:MAG: LpqB family beta-propeller domain-containing protein [Vicinamibacterales bacterium]
MSEQDGPSAAGRDHATDRGTRLDSWKEIAAYVKRDVRTLQRWEKTAGLPVRRMQKPGLRAVYAYTADLDQWLRDQDPRTMEPAEAPAAARSRASAAQPATRPTWLLYTAAGAGLVLAATLALRPPAPAALGPLTARPITFEPGNERDPDVSPDGKYVAYAQQAPNLRTRVVVRPIDGGEPHDITPGTTDEWSPAWSPDGARLAFLRGDPAGTATLVLSSPLGGDERTLGTVRPYARRRLLLIGHLVAWTPDARHVVVPDQVTPGQGSLVLVATDTGERITLTTPGDARFDVEPSLSSDGRLLLFNRVRGEYRSEAFVQRLDASLRPVGEPRQLASAGTWNGTPRLLEDRGEVLTSSGPLPRLSLWRQPLDGRGPPVSLGIIGDNATQSAVDRRSGRIIARTFRSQADVLRFAVPASPGPTIDPPVEDFLQSTYIDRGPVYSPDGTQVAFISDRSGSRQLWVADAGGGNPVEWTQAFEADMPMPAWSPDGTRIAFAGIGPAGNCQLYVADKATRTAVRVTDDALDYVRPAWSPDGQSLYAAAADRSVYAVYRVPVAGGPAEKVLPGYINVIDVAPDGRGLYLVSRDRRTSAELAYVPLPAGPPVHLATMNFQDDAWMTRDGLYFLDRRADRPLAPVALTFRTHAGAVAVRQQYASAPGRGLSMSPDGRYAVTTRFVPAIADLLLLEPAP